MLFLIERVFYRENVKNKPSKTHTEAKARGGRVFHRENMKNKPHLPSQQARTADQDTLTATPHPRNCTKGAKRRKEQARGAGERSEGTKANKPRKETQTTTHPSQQAKQRKWARCAFLVRGATSGKRLRCARGARKGGNFAKFPFCDLNFNLFRKIALNFATLPPRDEQFKDKKIKIP